MQIRLGAVIRVAEQEIDEPLPTRLLRAIHKRAGALVWVRFLTLDQPEPDVPEQVRQADQYAFPRGVVVHINILVVSLLNLAGN